MNKSKSILDEGINGLGVGVVNVNSSEFKSLQEIIIERSKHQSEEQILENKLLSLQFQMQNYLDNDSNSIIEVGTFLKRYLKEFNVKHKTFAVYINLQESNLSALFSGKRKINPDLALKLGQIFNIDPNLWIHIQSKNELAKLKESNKNIYKELNIKDLLRKTG